MSSEITRREALKRAAWMLGGTLSAPTILGVLAGCGGDRAGTTATWTPRTLTADQRDTVRAIAEAIIPTTDTPGANAAGVDRFVDAMLSDYYAAAERDRFLAGLKRLDARTRRDRGKGFNELTPEQQVAIVREMDRLAFTDVPKQSASKADDPSVTTQKSDVAVGQGVGANPKEAATQQPEAEDVGPKSFFRRMKELAIVGYYTSTVGQTKELRLTPWGHYADIPYKPGTPAWA